MQIKLDLMRSVELGKSLNDFAHNKGYDPYELLVSTFLMKEVLIDELDVSYYDIQRIIKKVKELKEGVKEMEV